MKKDLLCVLMILILVFPLACIAQNEDSNLFSAFNDDTWYDDEWQYDPIEDEWTDEDPNDDEDDSYDPEGEDTDVFDPEGEDEEPTDIAEPSSDEKKRERLFRQNLQLAEGAIGSTAKVLFVGFVYTRPNGNAATLGRTVVNRQYKILDFQQNSLNSAYFKIQYGGEDGWIAINKVQVTKAQTTNKTCSVHTSGQAEILYGGSYVRSGPGTWYAKIITVNTSERYKILGCEIDADGKHWLKIQVGNRQGYILAARCAIRK